MRRDRTTSLLAGVPQLLVGLRWNLCLTVSPDSPHYENHALDFHLVSTVARRYYGPPYSLRKHQNTSTPFFALEVYRSAATCVCTACRPRMIDLVHTRA